MTAPPPTIISGHCGIRRHGQCVGRYAGYDCRCECHTAPEPEPEPPSPAVTVELLEQPSHIHCPTCTCGDPTP